MNHELKSINEFNIEKYLRESNDINIVVTPSYYWQKEEGAYKCLLSYKHHKKIIEGSVKKCVSANQAMVFGLKEAVGHIRLHGVNVCIISGAYVGFKSAEKNKGVHAKEVNMITSIVEQQGNTISSIAVHDGGAEIKRIINTYKNLLL